MLNKNLVLVGEQGSGKSTILSRVVSDGVRRFEPLAEFTYETVDTSSGLDESDKECIGDGRVVGVVGADSGFGGVSDFVIESCSDVVFVVNRMDAVEYREGEFHRIVSSVERVLSENDFSGQARFIPACALTGENIVWSDSEKGSMGWYRGDTLVDVLLPVGVSGGNRGPPPRRVESPRPGVA